MGTLERRAGTPEDDKESPASSGLERSFVRQHYIDWLRVLAVLLLFPFHTLRVYNTELRYVKAARLSTAVTYLLDFISAWHMQLLFLLAGASTCFALRKRGNRQYVGERFVRLGVPLVFGVLVLVPPQCTSACGPTRGTPARTGTTSSGSSGSSCGPLEPQADGPLTGAGRGTRIQT